MISFCGVDNCKVDGAGRVRFAQRVVDDFLCRCQGEVVLFGLPEGAVAVYPQEVYREMRRREVGDLDAAGTSYLVRRNLRRFGAMAHPAVVSAQGRVTLPEFLQKHAGISAGCGVKIVGVEIGVEIWNTSRFDTEMQDIEQQNHAERQNEISSCVKGDGK